MKNFSILTFVLVLFLLWACSPKNTAVKTGTTTAPATATATANNMIAKSGEFKTGGTISFDAASSKYEAQCKFNDWHFSQVSMKKGDIESLAATLKVDLASIWEKNDDLTAHLNAPDFFYTEKFTTATIEIDNVKQIEGDNYQANMKLKMKGLSQDVLSDFTVTNKSPLHVKGSAKIDRYLFGLGDKEMSVDQFIMVDFDTEVPE